MQGTDSFQQRLARIEKRRPSRPLSGPETPPDLPPADGEALVDAVLRGRRARDRVPRRGGFGPAMLVISMLSLAMALGGAGYGLRTILPGLGSLATFGKPGAIPGTGGTAARPGAATDVQTALARLQDSGPAASAGLPAGLEMLLPGGMTESETAVMSPAAAAERLRALKTSDPIARNLLGVLEKQGIGTAPGTRPLP
ncbi:hypothetical protein [Salipiger sp.]|uniref:hypothetical protein n=1 Tax=Salipiger sp. TaxID=2078585 RepID=UPI003A97E764